MCAICSSEVPPLSPRACARVEAAQLARLAHLRPSAHGTTLSGILEYFGLAGGRWHRLQACRRPSARWGCLPSDSQRALLPVAWATHAVSQGNAVQRRLKAAALGRRLAREASTGSAQAAAQAAAACGSSWASRTRRRRWDSRTLARGRCAHRGHGWRASRQRRKVTSAVFSSERNTLILLISAAPRLTGTELGDNASEK